MFSFRASSRNNFISLILCILLGVTCFGQQPSPGGPDGPPQGPGAPGRPRPGSPGGPGGPLSLGPPGRWWDDPIFVKKLSLSDDQQKKMDEIFNTNRLTLIDRFAAVQKEEAILEPLVATDPPDENKVLAQIDRVAQARAELEKANARMLLGIRRQLTHEQWVKLKERPPMHGIGGPHDGGPGPGGGHPPD
jgi:Spy/CpxP family protein refolding chaperone